MIVAVIAGSMLPAVGMAKSAASVTITLSVYLKPAQPTSHALLASAGSSCTAPTVGNATPGNVQCVGQSAVYTWHKSSAGTTLVIAPI